MTERIEIRTNPGPPSADRDMTFDEKRKLSVFISSLDGDKLEQVLEILMQEEPDLPGMFCSPSYIHSFFASLIHSFFYAVIHPSIHAHSHPFIYLFFHFTSVFHTDQVRTVLHVSSSLYKVLFGQFWAMSNGY